MLLCLVALTARPATAFIAARSRLCSGESPVYNRHVVVDSLAVTCRCCTHLARAWKCWEHFQVTATFEFPPIFNCAHVVRFIYIS
ncbi:hypothetical protein SPTER_01510 [Sporomusa termitida]|uniref:Secreted protein n=1 Tax=Sporomusa termitida TaxID=2377 RepID=A0A517DNG7_9FIRM|nr:hypothetical protein SPTER_01510 [Sporomusa termitida]